MRSCSRPTARTRVCTGTGRARLWLSAAVAILALPAAASATVTLDQFTVTPGSTQAGSHPSVTIYQHLVPSSTDDDVKDTFVRLAPGLLGNPQSATVCTSAQLRSSAGCPDSAQVGTVHVTANVHVVAPLVSVSNFGIDGKVYNLRPTGPEPARLGLKLTPAALPAPLPPLGAVYLESPAYLRPGADGVGLESSFSDQPQTQSGLNIQITSVSLTFVGRAARGSFMRMPTSCSVKTSLSRVNSWLAPTTFSQRTSAFTPTGCSALGFSPTAVGSLGSPATTKKGSFPPLSTTLRFDPEQAALKSAEVTLPKSLTPNIAVLPLACSHAQADATACPASSRVGTAVIASPLQAKPVSGPVYLAYNTPAALPGLMIVLPPPVGLRIDGTIESTAAGLKNTFPSNPDLPLTSFTLTFGGGAAGAVQLGSDLCAPSTPTALAVKLTAHNGKVRQFSQELATPGCDPFATVKVTRHKKRYTLAAVLTAARRGPDLTAAKLSLPKALKGGKGRPRLIVDGKRKRAGRARRSVAPKLGGHVRRVKIVWKGLVRTRGRKVRRTLTIPVTLKDTRGKKTTLRVRVRVRAG
jgi:hypothetical protein